MIILNCGFRAISIAISLTLFSSFAFAKDPEPTFIQKLYPPELVMENHRAIGLRKDQRKEITQAIQATQASTVELSWTMQDAAGRLTKEMSQPRIDQKAALEAAEEMMAVEGQVKRAHLRLLIRIKNTLEIGQQEKLDAIREGRD